MKDKLLIRAKRLLKRRDWLARILSKVTHKLSHKWTNWLNFSGSYTFIDRSKGAQRLLIVLAGYKSFLWPLTLTRLVKFIPSDIDVCILSSGLYSAQLAELATNQGWSYLYTKANKVSLVQNLAIAKHKAAKWIYKLDEDIFITKNFFDLLFEGYLRIKEEGLYDPGFCSPLINVNTYSYISFLRIMNADDEYKAKFGELKHAVRQIKVQSDGEAAKWLWHKSLPFDDVARYVSSKPFKYSAAPHRFSIGAILFERDLWETIGGFRVSFKEELIGIDEEYLCKDCIEMSKAMLVIHNLFAGHFSYGPQEASMKEYLKEICPQISFKESGNDL
jgi:hypothetical protein